MAWLLSDSEVDLEELADERVWLECFSLALVLTSFFLTDLAFCEAESLDSSSSNFQLWVNSHFVHSLTTYQIQNLSQRNWNRNALTMAM